MTKVEKIKFISEIADMEGGCIALSSKMYSIYRIEYIMSSGIIRDHDTAVNKPYTIPMSSLDEDYIDYVYREVNAMNYYPDFRFDELLKIVKNEAGKIEFLNKITVNEGHYIGSVINYLFLDKHGLKANVGKDSNVDVYLLDQCTIGNIQEQIKYNKYL